MKPYLKWAGWRRRQVLLLQARIPAKFGTYFEPFIGGGALFFATQPKWATLSDANERLVRTYVALRDNVEGVIDILRRYPHDKAFFDAVRKQSATIDGEEDAEVAAWFIYSNRTSFNGLYRVNQQNHFNTPFGKYKNPTICDETLLRSCSKALQGVTLKHAKFEEALLAAKRGDLVYADPPYLPTSKTSSFTSYTANGFDVGDGEIKRSRQQAQKTFSGRNIRERFAWPGIQESCDFVQVCL
jgi:DNA adenine methylase